MNRPALNIAKSYPDKDDISLRAAHTAHVRSMSDLEWLQFTMAKMIVEEELGVDRTRFDMSPEAMLVDDLGADSLDMVNIQEAMERRGFAAPDDAFHWGMTLSDLAALVDIADHMPRQKEAQHAL